MTAASARSRAERRRHPRAGSIASAIVRVRHNAGIVVSIESISSGGARFAGPLTLAVGERVLITFDLEGTLVEVEVEGEIVRVERDDLMTDRVAVAFRNVSEEARVVIHELVASALDDEYGLPTDDE